MIPDPVPGKSSGSMRIHNTGKYFMLSLPISGSVPSLVAKEIFLSSGRRTVSDTSGADSSSCTLRNLNKNFNFSPIFTIFTLLHMQKYISGDTYGSRQLKELKTEPLQSSCNMISLFSRLIHLKFAKNCFTMFKSCNVNNLHNSNLSCSFIFLAFLDPDEDYFFKDSDLAITPIWIQFQENEGRNMIFKKEGGGISLSM